MMFISNFCNQLQGYFSVG